MLAANIFAISFVSSNNLADSSDFIFPESRAKDIHNSVSFADLRAW